MLAIEKASDAQTNLKQLKGCANVIVKSIALDSWYCDLHRTSSDIALALNYLEPKLGDRVSNLTAEGVPFGLRGTVIIIHSNTNYVEVNTITFINITFIYNSRSSLMKSLLVASLSKALALNSEESCVHGRVCC